MHIRVGEFEELVLDGTIGRAIRCEFHADDALGVEVGDEELQRGVGTAVFRDGFPEAGSTHGHVAEVMHHGHRRQGARESSDDVRQVDTLVDAAGEPVDERVAARLAIVKVLDADHFALRREVDLNRIIAGEQGVPLDISAIGLHAPDTRALAFEDHLAVFASGLVALTAVAPIEASVRVKEGAVDVGGVTGVVETADDHLTLIRHAVAIGVSQFPDARRGGDIEAAVEPLGAGRESHLVREDRAAVE